MLLQVTTIIVICINRGGVTAPAVCPNDAQLVVIANATDIPHYLLDSGGRWLEKSDSVNKCFWKEYV